MNSAPSYADTLRQKRRLSWFTICLVVLGLALLGRLWSLQVALHRHYLVLASQQQSRRYEVPARRGEIYLTDGDNKAPVALNQTLKVIYADPTKVGDKVKAARELSQVLGDSEDSIYKKLNTKTEYAVIKEKVPIDLAAGIAGLKLAGISSFDRPYRTYPEGQLAASVVGFVNSDGVGQYGIEGYLNNQLTGAPGLTSASTDTRGNPIQTSAKNIVNQPVDGANYTLTIDRNVQSIAEKYLKEGVERVHAKSGSVIIMDPNSGAIRAMANYPTYDPNQYWKTTDYNVFENASVADQFEPGSGFKIITMAAGLDSGKVRKDTTYNDTGEEKFDGYTIHNSENHKFGTQDMLHVIKNSLNTGVIFVLKTLGGDPNSITLAGKKTLYEYITKHFGFGTRTGVEQSGEAAGSVNAPNSSSINYANMTFGQGISVTMLQMVNAIGTISNGGTMYKPYLVASTSDANGNEVATKPAIIQQHVISTQAAKDLDEMMISVVEGGSGYQTRMNKRGSSYKIAGKTGTAQIPREDGKGYQDGVNIGSFVGYAPVGAPKFVMMVRINEPGVVGFAEDTAVPVFHDIAGWLFKYYGVAPIG